MHIALNIFILLLTFFYFGNLSAQEADKKIEPQKFAIWLDDFKKEALLKGLKPETIDNALANVTLIEKVIELDRKQPEKADFTKYKSIVLTKERIETGKKLLSENKGLLEKVAKKYGVQPRFIVALWGIETNYGKRTGDYHVPSALATLTFEGRRANFFKKELYNAIQIIDEGHIKALDMKGSWAGAMGQSQFMPSSFVNFAEDFNGDGKRDIWQTREDVFASIANYLSKSGWNNELTWGRKVKLVNNYAEKFSNLKPNLNNAKKLEEWQKLGVRTISGGNLPQKDIKAYLVFPNGEKNDAILVYENYKIILHWNRSLFFATAVGLLSDAIGR